MLSDLAFAVIAQHNSTESPDFESSERRMIVVYSLFSFSM